jgi:hypothetical protein
VIAAASQRDEQRRLPKQTHDTWTTHVSPTLHLSARPLRARDADFPNSPAGFELAEPRTSEHRRAYVPT